MVVFLLTLPGMYFTVAASITSPARNVTDSCRRHHWTPSDTGGIRMKQTLILCAITLALAGCAGGIDQNEYNQLATEAENEIKLASKTGFMWTGTEKFLTDSKAAMDAANAASDKATRESEYNKAMKLAKKALSEAKMAQQQAKDNANPSVRF
jgi:outer membrane murein-binding lipoprotein Lpp